MATPVSSSSGNSRKKSPSPSKNKPTIEKKLDNEALKELEAKILKMEEEQNENILRLQSEIKGKDSIIAGLKQKNARLQMIVLNMADDMYIPKMKVPTDG